MERFTAKASIPDTSFSETGTGNTLHDAQMKALELIDAKIDKANGLSHGLKSLQENRRLKNLVELVPPLEN